jgi:hypothetical protein
MQVTCGDCGKRCSLPDDVPMGRHNRCSMCGAELAGPSGDGSGPRAELDTLRLDATSLATLVRLGEATHTSATRGDPNPSFRAPQVSIPFELARQRALPLGSPRAPQASIPFELVRQEASASVREAPPDALPEVSAAPRMRLGEPGAEEWEGTFVSRVRGRRKKWGLALFLLFTAILLAVGALVVSGKIDPHTLLH